MASGRIGGALTKEAFLYRRGYCPWEMLRRRQLHGERGPTILRAEKESINPSEGGQVKKIEGRGPGKRKKELLKEVRKKGNPAVVVKKQKGRAGKLVKKLKQVSDFMGNEVRRGNL